MKKRTMEDFFQNGVTNKLSKLFPESKKRRNWIKMKKYCLRKKIMTAAHGWPAKGVWRIVDLSLVT